MISETLRPSWPATGTMSDAYITLKNPQIWRHGARDHLGFSKKGKRGKSLTALQQFKTAAERMATILDVE